MYLFFCFDYKVYAYLRVISSIASYDLKLSIHFFGKSSTYIFNLIYIYVCISYVSYPSQLFVLVYLRLTAVRISLYSVSPHLCCTNDNKTFEY